VDYSDLNFPDLSPVEIPDIQIGDRKYTLREASGDAGCKFRNQRIKATKLGPDGKPIGIDGFADADPHLLSRCLFEQTERGLMPVPVLTILGWKDRIQVALTKTLKQISNLDEPETEEELQRQLNDIQTRLAKFRNGHEGSPKNLPSAMTNTSV
jgi:hypothetical protein